MGRVQEAVLLTLEQLRKDQTLVRPEWLSVRGVSVYTSLSTTHINRAIRSGALAVSNMGSTGGRPLYRVSRESVEVWMKGREAGFATSPGPKGPKVVNLFSREARRQQAAAPGHLATRR
jgi:hypothetical protein